MKKKTVISGILILGIVALTAVAFADFGYGHHMRGYGMGSGMMGPGYYGDHMMGWDGCYGMGSGMMMGPGYHGGHMMDRDGGYGYNGYADWPKKDREAFDAAQKKFYSDTRGLRNKLDEKEYELRNEIMKENPNKDKAVRLQKEVSELQTTFDQKVLEHKLETRNLIPDTY